MIGAHGHHIADAEKMVGQLAEAAAATQSVRDLIDRDYCSCMDFVIDLAALRRYGSPHIRPLAVRPLNHPESVPNPWGFSFSGVQCRSVCGEARQ